MRTDHDFPDADTADYRIVFVIADQGAAKFLGEYDTRRPTDAKNAPGNGIRKLPFGTTETDLILGGP